MLEVRILNANEVRTYVDQVRRIHDVCFPDDVDDVSGSDDEGGLSNFETKDDRFWDRLAACHNTEHVLWFLLVDSKLNIRASSIDSNFPKNHE